MLLTLRLMENDWYDYMNLSLVFQGANKGTWKTTNTNWINLVAYETEGTFTRGYYAGRMSVLCYDGHSEGPAFVLVNGPSGEWSKHPAGGDAGLIENPRNTYGLRLDMTWTDSNLVETKL